jgi:hypothetical protein
MKNENLIPNKGWGDDFCIFSCCAESLNVERAGVNFTNVLRAAFPPILLRQKSAKPNFKYKKTCTYNFCTKKAAHKILVNLTPGVLSGRIGRKIFPADKLKSMTSL